MHGCDDGKWAHVIGYMMCYAACIIVVLCYAGPLFATFIGLQLWFVRDI